MAPQIAPKMRCDNAHKCEKTEIFCVSFLEGRKSENERLAAEVLPLLRFEDGQKSIKKEVQNHQKSTKTSKIEAKRHQSAPKVPLGASWRQGPWESLKREHQIEPKSNKKSTKNDYEKQLDFGNTFYRFFTLFLIQNRSKLDFILFVFRDGPKKADMHFIVVFTTRIEGRASRNPPKIYQKSIQIVIEKNIAKK